MGARSQNNATASNGRWAHTVRPALARRWPRIRLGLTVIFFGTVAVLLVINAREIAWQEVAGVIRGYGAGTLIAATALAAAGHLIYTTYDLLGRRYTGHNLPPHKVMSIAFVSYAFNLNMGPLVGAMAFRYRLYSGIGLPRDTITRVLAFSVVSNWLGYGLLAGILFAARAVALPQHWAIGTAALQAVGAGLLLLVVAYVWWCASAEGRTLTVGSVTVEAPPLRVAGAQLAASCASWMTMGAVIYVLMHDQVGYPTVLGVLLLAAVTALATHIPAGLGVLEASFVLLLGHLLPRHELLAAVLAYRVFYYLIPLVLALVMFGWLESRRRR